MTTAAAAARRDRRTSADNEPLQHDAAADPLRGQRPRGGRPGAVPCGRTLTWLRSLEGRAEDVLRLGDVAVHPLQFASSRLTPPSASSRSQKRGPAAAGGSAKRLRGRGGAPGRASPRPARGARRREARGSVSGGRAGALGGGAKLQVVVADRSSAGAATGGANDSIEGRDLRRFVPCMGHEQRNPFNVPC